jgi:hypothetical protein
MVKLIQDGEHLIDPEVNAFGYQIAVALCFKGEMFTLPVC